MKFKIAWWNTRLSPPKGNKLGDDESSFVLQTIVAMLNGGIEILGLGEVDDADIDAISLLVGDGYEIRRHVTTAAGRKFHMCLVSRNTTVALHSSAALTRKEGRRNFRIGVSATYTIADLTFELYCVHWPSRLYAKQEGFDRNFFGFALREDIDQKIEFGRRNIIVMGDFNDEPYNTSMNERLLATRDPSIASRTPDLLYNPFWKRMAPAVGHVPNAQSSDNFGSFFYAGNSLSKWHTLDQLLVSGSFLGTLTWHLSEAETDVWRPRELVQRVASTKYLMDHFPVIGTFVRH